VARAAAGKKPNTVLISYTSRSRTRVRTSKPTMIIVPVLATFSRRTSVARMPASGPISAWRVPVPSRLRKKRSSSGT
jgi:hypothetical protein